MNAVIVGADQLGGIPGVLSSFGIAVSKHISGRQAAHQRKIASLPKDAELLILFTDFLGHNVMRHFRARAEEDGVKVLACRRSVAALSVSLQRHLGEPAPH